jgi:Cof subfamily protein (haloacid dehalogenase superfamily)
MIKMIVSDMDGTLLNSEKQLPADFTEVYQLMKGAGIRFVVASGRQFYTLVDVFAHFNHDIAFVAENGAYINWDSETRINKPMKAIEAKTMIELLRQIPGTNIVLCGQKGAYVEGNPSDEFMTELVKYYARHSVVSDLLEVDDDILKIAVNNFEQLETVVYPKVKAEFEQSFQISTSSPIWFDVMSIGVNKGNAVQLLQKEMGITPEETMAFGDYLNDYEMLQVVHHSYAMENAHPDVKKIARHITSSNDDNGVMVAIRKQLALLADK